MRQSSDDNRQEQICSTQPGVEQGAKPSLVEVQEPEADLTSGEIWNGRYSVIKLLGTNATSTVYLASHIQLRTTVTLKIMRRQLMTRDAKKLFMREARWISAFSHANVVKLYSYGQSDNHAPFMAFEFIEGKTLAFLIEEDGSIEASRAVAVARQICWALAALREAGVIHRRIQPSAIVIGTDQDGSDIVKITELSLVPEPPPNSEPPAAADSTRSECSLLSAESGPTEQVNASQDIQSIGYLLYEMLCGRPVDTVTDAQPIPSQNLSEQNGRLPTRNTIPAALEQIILTCLNQDSQNGYQNAFELDAALSDIGWQPLSSPPTPAPVTGEISELQVRLMISVTILIALAALAAYLSSR